MKSIVIKKLDELELKAAALAQTRQKEVEAASTPPPLSFSGVLGLIFGLAEARLLAYDMPTPLALPGTMPFEVSYHSNDTHKTYYFASTITCDVAQGLSHVLANGLWQRLKPSTPIGSGPDGILLGRMERGWAIIDEACNPTTATGVLRDTVEHWVRHSTFSDEITGFGVLREALKDDFAPNDSQIISDVFRRWGWDRSPWGFTNHSFYEYPPVERGGTFNEEAYY